MPIWHQAIIWINDGLLLTATLETNFSEIWIKIQQSSYKKMKSKCFLPNAIIFSGPECVDSGRVSPTSGSDFWLKCTLVWNITSFRMTSAHWICIQCQNLGKIFTGPNVQVIFELYGHFRCYKSFIPNKTIFTKYCLTKWISKLPRSFEIYWARQYLVNFLSLAGTINKCLQDYGMPKRKKIKT